MNYNIQFKKACKASAFQEETVQPSALDTVVPSANEAYSHQSCNTSNCSRKRRFTSVCQEDMKIGRNSKVSAIFPSAQPALETRSFKRKLIDRNKLSSWQDDSEAWVRRQDNLPSDEAEVECQ